MTQNLYMGADLAPVIAAARTSLDAVPAATARIHAEILASDVPGRLALIASEIAATRPHVVCVQEAMLLGVRRPSSLTVPPFTQAPATDVDLDYCAMLMAALVARGLVYRVGVAAVGNDNQAPAGTPPALIDFRLTDRDVILVSDALETTGLAIVDAGSHVFEAQARHGPFVDLRAWAHLDLNAGDRTLRIVTTHLHPLLTPEAAALQLAQGEELIARHAGFGRPLVITGDFNSRADAAGTPTWRRFIDAGFSDAWMQAGRGPGFTWTPGEDLHDAKRVFDQRIDFVLLRDGVTTVDALVVGEDPARRTPSGLWASDHAGVVATLRLTS